MLYVWSFAITEGLNFNAQTEIIRVAIRLGGDVLTHISKSIEIRTPPEKIWEMLALDRLSEWEEGYKEDLTKIEYTSEVNTLDDKYKVGFSAQLETKGEGQMNLEITGSLENEKIVYHLVGGKFTKDLRLTFLLDPLEEGTEFTYVVDYEISWGILGKFLDKLFIHRKAEKDLRTEMENLKGILEQ